MIKFVKQKEDAEEIVQEVFLKIWERAKNLIFIPHSKPIFYHGL
ncbi:MAG: hypothetical protein HC905_03120 [Bacteroidales bacterium]|nr:hypothetical protein [Bacteroidales bacterium]